MNLLLARDGAPRRSDRQDLALLGEAYAVQRSKARLPSYRRFVNRPTYRAIDQYQTAYQRPTTMIVVLAVMAVSSGVSSVLLLRQARSLLQPTFEDTCPELICDVLGAARGTYERLHKALSRVLPTQTLDFTGLVSLTTTAYPLLA